MAGWHMLLIQAAKAFVPKETAEHYAKQAEEVSAIVEGMIKDGTLAGIGNLVADIQEIKQRQARLELGLAKIYASLSADQCLTPLHGGGKEDGLSGSAALRSVPLALVEHGTDGGRGTDIGASRVFDAGHDIGAGPAGSAGKAEAAE